VAELTGLLVEVKETGGVEPGAVGVHSQACSRGVTSHAVGLLVTGDATLEVLSGGEGVAEESYPLIVVEAAE
jgi:hypothetical protein